MLTANIHNAVAVQVERIVFPTFNCLRFVVTTADGQQVEISTFSAEPLTLTDTAATLPTPMTQAVTA